MRFKLLKLHIDNKLQILTGICHTTIQKLFVLTFKLDHNENMHYFKTNYNVCF